MADLPPGRFGGPGTGASPYSPPAGPVTGRVQIGYLKPEETPDRWAGYDAAHLVVLGNVTANSLSARQQAALLEWVRMGGTAGGERRRQDPPSE